MLIERLLSNRGHVVDRATDGEAVLEMLRDHRYDLILMDCQMPVRDGYDTTRELRHRGARARRGEGPVPVVAMTASAMDETRQRCSDAGMNGYLGKPIMAEDLDRVLATWLPDGGLSGGGPASALPEEGAGGVLESTGDGEGGISLEPRQLDQLRRVYPGDKLDVVLRELADEVTDDLDELTAALETGDQARIASAAHRIRNTGRVVGARELADTAAELDHPPQDDEPPLQFDPAVVQRLRDLWERVQEALAEVSRP